MNSNEKTNAILSFILPGVGQILNGETEKGIKMIIMSVILYAVTYFLLKSPLGHGISIAYQGYAAYDAYTCYEIKKE